MNHTRRHHAATATIRTVFAVAVLSGLLVGPSADALPTQSPDDRIVALERRVVAFDGRTSRSDHEDAVVALDADVFFDFDSDLLTDQAHTTLVALVTEIVDSKPAGTVTVIGHTDNTGTSSYNLDLSQRRADVVTDVLVANSELTVTTEARGEQEPVATNDTKAGRRRNRRVEIRYTPTTSG